MECKLGNWGWEVSDGENRHHMLQKENSDISKKS